MPPDTLETDPLVDRAPILRAQAVLEAAELAVQEARSDAQEAERHFHAARAAFSGLVDAAAAGRRVSRREVIAAHAEAEAAERWSSFAAAVARARTVPVEIAQAALADVRAEAWRPVIDAAVERRIAVARKADRIRAMGQNGSAIPAEMHERQLAVAKAMAAMQPEFAAANALLEHAERNGARPGDRFPGDRPRWPTGEAAERKYWGRSVTLEEITNAA